MTTAQALSPRTALDLRLGNEAGHFVGGSVPEGDRPVFGGQLLGQLIVAAAAVLPEKQVRSVHATFMRTGAVDVPLDIVADPLHQGRSLATCDIAVVQGGREICHGLVMADASDPDVLDFSEAAEDFDDPERWRSAAELGAAGAEVRFVGDLDLNDVATGPAEVAAWVRWDDPGPAAGQAVHQGLAAWFSDPLLIPASLRPLADTSVAMAHHSLSTGVLQHTMVFHRDLDAGQWLRYDVRTVQAGAGRLYGEGRIRDESGGLVASFSQWAMVRPMPQRRPGSTGPAM